MPGLGVSGAGFGITIVGGDGVTGGELVAGVDTDPELEEVVLVV